MRDKLRRPKALAALPLLLTLTGCPENPDPELEHGVVWLQLLRGESEASDPYEGTAKIEVTLLYRECLVAFYESNPDYQQFGPEGSIIFGTLEDGGEGWKDRLCDQSNRNALACSVDSFRQEFDVAKQLTITYSPTGDLENREVPFGPIPTAELAHCEGGGSPIVRVGSNGAVRGLAGDGSTLWNTESFNPEEAATGQGAPIKIKAARVTN
ncbi:MAG: hypothetical protein KDK70_32965 [Myxococcales bacterium]|nr:hypothetical protein [Myxococcales bacterium]